MKHRALPTVLLCALCASCGDDAVDNPIPEQPFEFQSESCGTALVGTAAADPDVLAETGIARYEFDVDREAKTITVGLQDESGQSLGTIRIVPELRTEALSELIITSTYEEGGTVRAQQVTVARRITGGRMFVQFTDEVGSDRMVSWSTLDDEFLLEDMTIGAPVNGDPDPNQGGLRTIEGSFNTVEVFANGSLVDENAARAFLESSGLSRLTRDPSYLRLMRGANDRTWHNRAESILRNCRAFVPATEEGMLVRGLSARTHKEALECEGVNPYEATFGAIDAYGAIGDGLEIAGALAARGALSGALGGQAAAATGALAAGAGVAGAFAATVAIASVGAYVADSMIGDAVNENRGAVVDGLFGAAEVAFGVDGSAAAEFFGGSAGSAGDPHLDTLDRLRYDFQGAGEFVLIEAIEGAPFVVQVRQEPRTTACSGVSFNTALATKMGSYRVGIYGDTQALVVDSEEVDVPGGVLNLPGGGAIEKEDGAYVLLYANGEALRVSFAPLGTIDIQVALPGHRKGQLSGLLGTFNDDPSDDIRLRDGALIEAPVDWEVLEHSYADSWRISATESLFEYEDGESTSTFILDGFPERPQTVEDLPQADRDEARAACSAQGIQDPGVLSDCILDVACTGDTAWAESHKDRSPGSSLGVSQTTFLDGWSQQGLLNNGIWSVSADGRSVDQAIGGDATFFVGPRDLIDVTVRGTVHVVTNADDDHIGFVFGYEAPLSENGDPEEVFKSYLFTWKGATEGAALEGATLGYMDGDLSSPSAELFSQIDSPAYTVVARANGSYSGWEPFEHHDFSVSYGRDRIQIAIDGAVFFDLDKSEIPTPINPGRFGFYTNSEGGVDFSDIRIGPFAPVDTTPRTCNAILASEGSRGDGIYRVLSGDRTKTVPVYCDMTTDGGGWTMVYKKSAGVMGDSHDLFVGGALNEEDESLLDKAPASSDYVSGFIEDGFSSFSEARVEVVDPSGPGAFLSFSTVGTTTTSWFTPERLTDSSWTDLAMTTDWSRQCLERCFSIVGYEPYERRWYVNRDWGGCASDKGWLVVTHGVVCQSEWQEGTQDFPTQIRYAASSSIADAIDPNEYRHGGALIVFMR